MSAFVGYGETPQFRLDIEHPASSVVFGVELYNADTGASVAEYTYTYGTDSEVSKLDTPVIVGGESYVLTLPPVVDGMWEVSARTNYGTVVHMERFRVTPPSNSKLIHEPPP